MAAVFFAGVTLVGAFFAGVALAGAFFAVEDLAGAALAVFLAVVFLVTVFAGGDVRFAGGLAVGLRRVVLSSPELKAWPPFAVVVRAAAPQRAVFREDRDRSKGP